MLCLATLSGNNFDNKTVQLVQKELVAEFGAAGAESALNLERLQLFSSNKEKLYWSWKNIVSQMNLYKNGQEGDFLMNSSTEKFAPLSVRLIQKIVLGDFPTIFKAFDQKEKKQKESISYKSSQRISKRNSTEI